MMCSSAYVRNVKPWLLADVYSRELAGVIRRCLKTFLYNKPYLAMFFEVRVTKGSYIFELTVSLQSVIIITFILSYLS
jgi:hypothetical protein